MDTAVVSNPARSPPNQAATLVVRQNGRSRTWGPSVVVQKLKPTASQGRSRATPYRRTGERARGSQRSWDSCCCFESMCPEPTGGESWRENLEDVAFRSRVSD